MPLSPPLCLPSPAGDAPVHNRPALLWNCSVLPLFCKWPAVPSVRALPRLILSLLLSHSVSCYLIIAPSDCPQGFQAWSLPKAMPPASSLFSPHLLVADVSVWGTFLLGVALRHVICGFYLFFLPVRLPSKIQQLPPDLPVRGFPGV